MKLGKISTAIVGIGLCSIAGVAHATLITHTDSYGIVWTLSSDGTNSGTVANPLYDVILSADTTNFSTNHSGTSFDWTNSYINTVTILANSSPTSGVVTGPQTVWTNVLGGSNSNGCDNTSTSHFDCAYSNPGPGSNNPPTGPGSIMNFNQGDGAGKLTWDFTLGFDANTTFSQALSTLTDGSHLKTTYYGYTTDQQTGGSVYTFIGQISDTVTINDCSNNNCGGGGSPPQGLPEPTTLALFGIGLLGAGFMRRRKAS